MHGIDTLTTNRCTSFRSAMAHESSPTTNVNSSSAFPVRTISPVYVRVLSLLNRSHTFTSHHVEVTEAIFGIGSTTAAATLYDAVGMTPRNASLILIPPLLPSPLFRSSFLLCCPQWIFRCVKCCMEVLSCSCLNPPLFKEKKSKSGRRHTQHTR